MGEFIKKAIIPVLIPLLFFAACSEPVEKAEAEPLAAGRTLFYAPAPSQLYFRNVRSAYYYYEKGPAGKADLYRLRKWELTRERPQMYPRIVHNWLEDEAYLLLEPNEYSGGFANEFRVRWSGERGEGEMQMGLRTKENQRAFAEMLYQHLREENALQILDAQGKWQPFLADRSDRNAFLITVRDYFRLVERDRTHK